MPNPFPVKVTDASGQTRIEGEMDFTDVGNQPGGGNALSETPGAGSPLGSVTPTGIGYLYFDTTNGAVWQAIGATDTDWTQVGGKNSDGSEGLDISQNSGFFLYDNAAGANGLGVSCAASAGTTRPLLSSSFNTLDDGNTGAATFVDTVTAGGEVDAASLGATIPYVTSQAGAPGAGYVTPLVFDTTAVTGGLYAWDGSAYVQVGGPI